MQNWSIWEVPYGRASVTSLKVVPKKQLKSYIGLRRLRTAGCLVQFFFFLLNKWKNSKASSKCHILLWEILYFEPTKCFSSRFPQTLDFAQQIWGNWGTGMIWESQICRVRKKEPVSKPRWSPLAHPASTSGLWRGSEQLNACAPLRNQGRARQGSHDDTHVT